jgi:hypothetical protein
MKFLVFLVFISVSQFYFSQIRYYAQGFENATTTCPENWTFSGGNRNTQHAQTGSYSARVGRLGESNSLILDPVNVSLLTNATLRLNHSILGGNGPGIDVREGVIFMICAFIIFITVVFLFVWLFGIDSNSKAVETYGVGGSFLLAALVGLKSNKSLTQDGEKIERTWIDAFIITLGQIVIILGALIAAAFIMFMIRVISNIMWKLFGR